MKPLHVQHRRPGCRGIATSLKTAFYLEKGNGLLTDVFDPENMARLGWAIWGARHVRLPTAGCSSVAEAQPSFTYNSPVWDQLRAQRQPDGTSSEIVDNISKGICGHLNTSSDSEVMLNGPGSCDGAERRSQA